MNELFFLDLNSKSILDNPPAHKNYIANDFDTIFNIREGLFVTLPEKISEEDYNYYLNCMPPINYSIAGAYESFQLCEKVTENIAFICVKYNNIYYKFQDYKQLNHDQIIKRVTEYYKDYEILTPYGYLKIEPITFFGFCSLRNESENLSSLKSLINKKIKELNETYFYDLSLIFFSDNFICNKKKYDTISGFINTKNGNFASLHTKALTNNAKNKLAAYIEENFFWNFKIHIPHILLLNKKYSLEKMRLKLNNIKTNFEQAIIYFNNY